MSGQVIAILCGLFSIGCGAYLFLKSSRRNVLPMSQMPESWLYANSLWDECDGEPMNEAAEELMRRATHPASSTAAKGDV